MAAHLPGKWCAGSNGFRVLRARSHVTPPMTWAADDLGMPVGYLALPAPTRLLLQSACVLRGCARATKSKTCHLMFSSCAHRSSLGTPSAEDDTLGESAVRFPWGPSTCVPYPRARCPLPPVPNGRCRACRRGAAEVPRARVTLLRAGNGAISGAEHACAFCYLPPPPTTTHLTTTTVAPPTPRRATPTTPTPH